MTPSLASITSDPRWWGLRADAWTAIATWATLAVLIATAVIALRQLFDARRLRDEEARPWVVVDLDIEKHPHMIHVYFQNFGKTVARNVRLAFEPPLESTLGSGRVEFLDHVFPTLAPGKRIETFFDSAIGALAAGSKTPRRYDVKVTYEDHQGDLFTDDYALDIEAFRNRHFVGEKDLDDLVKAVEDLRNTLARAVSNDSINVTTQTAEERRREHEEWLASLRDGDNRPEDSS